MIPVDDLWFAVYIRGHYGTRMLFSPGQKMAGYRTVFCPGCTLCSFCGYHNGYWRQHWLMRHLLMETLIKWL